MSSLDTLGAPLHHLRMRGALSWMGVLVVLSAVWPVTVPAEAQVAERFRALLAPHGTWVTVDGHGDAFVPREAEAEDFVPYLSGGRWEARDAGLSFVSVYAWGEVCFHQGRWLRTEETGTWVWLPGRAYASAWVAWRRRGAEVAWRALGPGDGPSDLRSDARSWNVAPREALGSALLATHALRVSEASVASFTAGGPSERDDPAIADAAPIETPRVERDQVLLSGGGRIVVHGPDGDRVLTTPPVVVSRATAEARAREQRERDEAREARELAAREERRREAAEQRERETLAAAERAATAADTAALAAVSASQSAQVAQTTQPPVVPVLPYGAYGFGGYGVYGAYGAYGIGGSRRAARVERPAPAPVTPAPTPPATPRTPPIVGRSQGYRHVR